MLDTVLELLSQVGYGFSVDDVASRAGVHKTTIYRNWSTKPQLVAAAIGRFAERDIVVRRTGDPVADVVALAEDVGAALRTTTGSNAIRAIVAAAADDTELVTTAERFLTGRYQLAIELIEEARTAGAIRADVDALVLWQTMVNPLHLRAILGAPADAAAARTVIDQVLDGALTA